MSERHAYIIGLTGNIATGKSTVAGMLARLGAHVIDADIVAHWTMRAGTPVWESIVSGFGQEVIGPDGEIDRKVLGAIVFADPEALRRLETIVHPAVIAEVDRRINVIAKEAAGQGKGPPVIVVEAVKLVESGMHAHYDALWVVTCAPEQQRARLQARGGLTEAEVAARIGAQPPASAKIALADVVITNDGSLQDTWAQVRDAWNAIRVARLDKKP